jgi:hypothetical protein
MSGAISMVCFIINNNNNQSTPLTRSTPTLKSVSFNLVLVPQRPFRTMFIATFIALQFLAAASALGSAPPIKNTPDVGAASAKLPPFTITTCPQSCPCCDWCEPLTQCRGRFLPVEPTYNMIRNIIGCNSLPEETPVCPIGKCNSKCLCRETLMKQLETTISGPGAGKLSDQSAAYDDDTATQDIEPANEGSTIAQSPFPDILPGADRLVPLLPPWYSVKPVCPKRCACCNWCQPITSGPGCDPYRAGFYQLPYPAARRAVGCDVLPATTPLCPPGECRGNCMCGEGLLEDLREILFGGE